ncbi:MAG: TetR/AcrR family transcriptional regulator [Chloroflexi bacterium]|nr:TetR/AcrR family transcriptional regulator [Chloroflexota bacterium]
MVQTRTETPRRQQIEDAASSLFRERGYAGTSVRDIAQRLSMQGGSLYAHMASKEDVLWSIVDRAARQFRDRVAPIAERPDPAATRLADMVRAHVGVVTEDAGHASAFLHEWRFLGTERRAAVAEQRDRYEALFRRVIGHGVAAGEFAPADPKLTATCLLSALNGIATWYRPDGELTPRQIADHYAELFTRALKSTPEELR